MMPGPQRGPQGRAPRSGLTAIYVPLRAVAELYGFQVAWNEAERSVSVTGAGGEPVGKVVDSKDGYTTKVGRFMVPVSFLSQLHLRAAVDGSVINLAVAE